MQKRDSAPDAPTQRILIVAEAIARQGPVTLAQLTADLGFSRVAIWRALNTLRAAGWVRMRAGDSAFEMRAMPQALFQAAQTTAPAIEALLPLMQRLLAMGPVSVDIGQFTAQGVFRIIETSRKEGYGGKPLSLTDDDLAIAAQLALTPQILVGHLRVFIDGASDDERRIVTTGEHGRALARLRDRGGAIWQADRTAVCFAAPDQPGAALRAELWRVTRADIERFTAQVTAVLSEM